MSNGPEQYRELSDEILFQLAAGAAWGRDVTKPKMVNGPDLTLQVEERRYVGQNLVEEIRLRYRALWRRVQNGLVREAVVTGQLQEKGKALKKEKADAARAITDPCYRAKMVECDRCKGRGDYFDRHRGTRNPCRRCFGKGKVIQYEVVQLGGEEPEGGTPVRYSQIKEGRVRKGGVGTPPTTAPPDPPGPQGEGG
jgi:hypothetical protein